ncbi:MAG: hypothetical protein ACHREM_08230 [Polyangiales bacterium]
MIGEQDSAASDRLTTSQLSRHLRVRSYDLRAAARHLGMVPGGTVTTEPGAAIVRYAWPREWIAELRAELDRRETIDVDEMCGGGAS